MTHATNTILLQFVKTLEDTVYYLNELLGTVEKDVERGTHITDYMHDAYGLLYEQKCAVDDLINQDDPSKT